MTRIGAPFLVWAANSIFTTLTQTFSTVQQASHIMSHKLFFGDKEAGSPLHLLSSSVKLNFARWISGAGGGGDIHHPSTPALGPIKSPVQEGTGSFPGFQRPGCGVNHPPSSSFKVKERVELYSPSMPTWQIIRWTLPLPLIITLQV